MNKLLTFPGLQPIYLGDFDFLQQSVNDAFLQLLKGLTGQDNPRCVLKSATPEKDGAICFDGEILPLKYFSGAASGALVYKIESSYSGERTFKDGNSHQCYESRYVIGTSGSTMDPNRASLFPQIHELLTRAVKINQSSSYSTPGAAEQIYLQRYISIVGNSVTISGKFTILEDCTIATLTEEKMTMNFPVGEWYFPVTFNHNGTLKTIAAKMSVETEDITGDNVATITIPSTTFSRDDSGCFTFTALNR